MTDNQNDAADKPEVTPDRTEFKHVAVVVSLAHIERLAQAIKDNLPSDDWVYSTSHVIGQLNSNGDFMMLLEFIKYD